MNTEAASHTTDGKLILCLQHSIVVSQHPTSVKDTQLFSANQIISMRPPNHQLLRQTQSCITSGQVGLAHNDQNLVLNRGFETEPWDGESGLIKWALAYQCLPHTAASKSGDAACVNTTGWHIRLWQTSVDVITKIQFWPDQARPDQAKTELLFWC